MEYNTQQRTLPLPEYGRSVQNMVDHALTIEDRAERQRCANTIINIMGGMFPHLRDVPDFKHKLWDHLAIMADFKLDAEDIDFLSSYDMVVSGLWGMIENDLPVLKEKGATVAFDFATRPDDPVSVKAIPYVDYGFFADDDKDEEELKKMLIDLHAKGPKVMVVTRGEKGSMAYDGEKFYYGGIVPCEVVDTMGAGDSFIAGFLYAICEGKGIQEAMADGAANSSVTIAYSGAW